MQTKWSGTCRAITCGVLLAMPLAAHADTAAPAPPEVKKTVEAFTGNWTLTGTDLEPGAQAPAPVKATLECKPAALGLAVNCRITAEVSGSRVEAAAIIGYSPDEHAVRWMEISSSGEYHDHRGVWKGNEIEFEPLTYTVSGAKMTEVFSPSFPSPGKTLWKVTVESSEGKSRMELTGTRSSAN